MPMRIDVSRRAERDINRQTDWYADQAVGVGQRWTAGVRKAMISLAKNPLRGGIAHETDFLGFELRELLYGVGRKKTHRILYRITPDVVKILAVRHVAQRDFTLDNNV